MSRQLFSKRLSNFLNLVWYKFLEPNVNDLTEEINGKLVEGHNSCTNWFYRGAQCGVSQTPEKLRMLTSKVVGISIF